MHLIQPADVCCLSVTGIQGMNVVVRLTSISVHATITHYVRPSDDQIATASGQTGVEMALRFTTKAACTSRVIEE